ncbi:MAG: hypothetical protein KC503_29275 [Myxococcales bacterium]|nr:hypothetical protein [Myxococcales bacterium]
MIDMTTTTTTTTTTRSGAEHGIGQQASSDGHPRRQGRDTRFAELLARITPRPLRLDDGEDRIGVPLDGAVIPHDPIKSLPVRSVTHFARRLHLMAREAQPGAVVSAREALDGVEVELAVEMLDARRVAVTARVADRSVAHQLQEAEEELRHALARWGLELARFDARADDGRRGATRANESSAAKKAPPEQEATDGPRQVLRPRHSYVEVIA